MSPFPYNPLYPDNLVSVSKKSLDVVDPRQIQGQSLFMAGVARISEQITVSGPTLLRFDGCRTAAGASLNNIGSWVFWANIITPNQGEYSAHESVGNYLYLPVAGVYAIRGANIGAGGPVVTVDYTRFENIDWPTALSYMTMVIPSTVITFIQVIAAATPTAIGDVSGAAQEQTNDAGAVRAFGKLFRIHAAKVSNVGANAVTIGVGNGAPTVVDGHPIAAGATQDFNLGLLTNSALYAFSTAGTTIACTISYR